MASCTVDRHAYDYPWGRAWMQGGYFVVNCGTDDNPEWFTCCELNRIAARRERRALSEAVPAERVLRDLSWWWRVVDAVDEWTHRYHHPAWRLLWRPLCNLREWSYLRTDPDR